MTERRTTASDPPDLPRTIAGFGLLRVAGRSMEPTLYTGDVVVARFPGGVKAGALVVVRLPGERPLAVKRAVHKDADGWWVERDNPREGIDSWSLGTLPDTAIVARVLLRIWPLRRARRRS